MKGEEKANGEAGLALASFKASTGRDWAWAGLG